MKAGTAGPLIFDINRSSSFAPAGFERVVVQNALPTLKNQLVYVAYETSVKGRIRSLIQMVEEEAIQTGTVFEDNGLRIRR